MNNWKKIWNDRKVPNKKYKNTLEKLIELNGFDSGAGKIKVEDWLDYHKYLLSKFDNITKRSSIFEFGCGSGALLFPFYKLGMQVGGCDYSEILIKTVNKNIKGEFYIQSAALVNPKKSYDYIVSNSVFQYFPTYLYAYQIVEKMLKIANKKIAILDINDKNKTKYAEKVRKGALSNNEYDKKYENLNHMYYKKDWWKLVASKLNCDIEIENQVIKNYSNAKFRYNVFLTKK